jgi:hypothetical protein
MPPPGRGRPKRHPSRVADQVIAVPRLGQGEPRLAALHPEPAAELRRVRDAPERGVCEHFGVQGLQFRFVRRRLRPIQPPERQVSHGHGTIISAASRVSTGRVIIPASPGGGDEAAQGQHRYIVAIDIDAT